MTLRIMKDGWRLSRVLVSGLCLAGMTACGGGDSSPTPAPLPDTSNNQQAPQITVAPVIVATTTGASATFSVQATGSGPLSYQWTLNAAPIDGATGATYTHRAMRTEDSGAVLRVNVNGPAGSAESKGIPLTVNGTGSRTLAGWIRPFNDELSMNVPGNLTALAVDRESDLYGIIGDKLWKIPRNSGSREIARGVCAGDGKIALDNDLNVYVGCKYSVLKVSAAGTVSIHAGSKTEQGAANGSAANARFGVISAVAVDNSGVVYVGDPDNGAIRRIGTDGTVTTLAGADKVGTPLDGAASAARFGAVRALALDSAGNLFVGDKTAIRKVTPAGMVSTVAGDPNAAGAADGTGAGARFASPAGLVLDSDGTLFVADTGNRTIRKVTAKGVVTTIAGRSDQPGSSDGFGKMAWFASPTAIAIDPAGLLYVADTPNHIVRKVTRAGAVSTYFGTPQTELSAGSLDGIGQEARFNTPTRMATDASGNVYVVDELNFTIRKITPAGVVSTIAGAPGISAQVDGPSAVARLSAPEAIAVTGDGTVYVVDNIAQFPMSQIAHVLRKITPEGVVSTVNVPPEPIVPNPTGPLEPPVYSSIAADRSGNYFLATQRHIVITCPDFDTRFTCYKRVSSTIRKITPAGAATLVTTIENLLPERPENASWYRPYAMAAGPDGSLYILAQHGTEVMKVTADGKISRLTAGKSQCPSDGSATFCIDTMDDMTIDAAGRVYATTRARSVLVMFTPDGVAKYVAGKYQATHFDATLELGALTGGLSSISGIAAAPDGTVYATVHNGVARIVHE